MIESDVIKEDMISGLAGWTTTLLADGVEGP
jgi:hypothetical protein